MEQYSFKDLLGAIDSVAGAFSLFGQIGAGRLTISNATERTVQAVSADGSIMVSYIAGRNGAVSIETQQTSLLHKYLLEWFNLAQTAADNGDVSGWASGTVSFRALLDGSYHFLTGVSLAKTPDKPYGSQGENVTWTLMAADVISGG
jgi:Protein of unknown function (DUF3277)